MAVIVCWRSGHVEVRARATLGAIELVRGPKSVLLDALSVHARHSYDGVTLLVPGVPEAKNDRAALIATYAFRARLQKTLSRLSESAP